MSTSSPITIAIVALDEEPRRRLEETLQAPRWRVHAVSRLAEAEHAIAAHDCRSVILSAAETTPDLLRRLGRRYPTVAALLWNSGLSSEAVAGLLVAGASDTLTSRMSGAEIHARIAGAIGGAAGQRVDSSTIGDLAVDSFRGETTWRGRRVPLTNRERDVLDVLMQDQGRTLRREVIYQRVWGHAMPGGDRNVDVNVKRLRSKLSGATDGRVTVETVNRVGYRLNIEPDDPGGIET